MTPVSDATTTDLYEITMAMSYLWEGMTGPATFSAFVRNLPSERGFLVAAGLGPALEYMAGFHVGPEDVDAFTSAVGARYSAALCDLCVFVDHPTE
jgi:nicotinate phosphoribosyltransferase